ncbi:P-loop containing nucleoside triphosphate hydrolase protein [Dioscorea alata]|uniref:P-loop containing nucleoside triphosphate hydrolase protein n=1 Tax=Dioscorea alata TaxID=55571 RepID=A0ACB7VSP3_DIOAL|nr:P-loop containing nucleoside triphosphate hydrolase protein [Dioscorea alata]
MTSFPQWEVVGGRISGDADEMIKLLFAATKPGVKSLVFGITGKGGIGKTTLARRIYDNRLVQAGFQVKVWLSISDEDLFYAQMLRETINQAGGWCCGDKTMSELEEMLLAVIQGKRLFLVFDGVFNLELCNQLLKLVASSCGDGSRVLLTSRFDDIARELGAVHLHKMSLLSETESWSLACKMFDFQTNIELVDIAKDGIDKCHGHPLALKLLGGIFAGHKRPEWKKVTAGLDDLKSEKNEFFLSVYEALPSHLKQCFLFCALFTGNRTGVRRDIIQLWIAEGLIKPEKNRALEDLAEEYYSEFVSRNLLQPEPENHEQELRCTMHQLLRELAQQLTQHCHYINGKVSSLTLLEKPSVTSNHVRVLDLRRTEIDEIPDSIGFLRYLKYLNLSQTKVRNLPDSVRNLSNLQFLSLNSCKKLESIPHGITQLCNLRSLDILHTKVARLPYGIKSMKHLNSLLGGCCYLLDELKTLSELRELHIENLNMAKTGGDVKMLSNKKFLQLLVLSWSHEPKPIITANNAQELCPSPSIKRLTITRFPGTEYPKWFSSSNNLCNLTLLVLEHCSFCAQLPSLGDLPELKYLRITGCKIIVTIDIKFFGEKAFPRLERLIMEEMNMWEKWVGPKSAFPSLRSLLLKNCPMLMSLPQCLQRAKVLTELVIQGADRLRALENFQSIMDLQIESSTNIEKVCNFPALKSLMIVKCPALDVVKNMPCLESLQLVDVSMDSLPVWFGSDMNAKLRLLDITGNDRLLNRVKKGGEEWEKIARIPRFIACNANKSSLISYY